MLGEGAVSGGLGILFKDYFKGKADKSFLYSFYQII